MKALHLRPQETTFLLKVPHPPPLLKARKLLLLRISNAELGENVKKSVGGS